MRISFHGAAAEVTGSCHLLESTAGRILLDCGLIQGGKERHERNRAPFGFDAAAAMAAAIDERGGKAVVPAIGDSFEV